MPIYATIADVAALAAKRPITATSVPNASQVARFLQDAQSEIDGILAGDGYEVPVPTGATIGLGLLRRYTALGAWAQTERSAQVAPDAKEAMALWAQAKTDLTRGTVQLADVPRLGGENFARGEAMGSIGFLQDMQL